MKTIWKFPLEITGFQNIQMPNGARVISTGLDPEGSPCLWAYLPDTEAPMLALTVMIAGTGNSLEVDMDRFAFVGTIRINLFVWHVFVQPVQ